MCTSHTYKSFIKQAIVLAITVSIKNLSANKYKSLWLLNIDFNIDYVTVTITVTRVADTSDCYEKILGKYNSIENRLHGDDVTRGASNAIDQWASLAISRRIAFTR